MQKRFKDFLDNLGDLVYEADDSGNVTYANKVCEIVTGVALKDIIGKPFLLLFTEESQEGAINMYQRTLQGESLEYDLTFANGRIWHFKNEPTRDKKGKIKGVFGFARDVTEQKRAEEALKRAYDELEKRAEERTRELIKANDQLKREINECKQTEKVLRESEKKYRSLVELANDGIAIIQDNLLKYVNPVLAQMAGYTVNEVIDTPFADYIHPDELSQVLDYHKRRMAGEKVPSTYETGLKHKNGSKIDVEFNAEIITYQEKPAAFSIVRDMTERKLAEEEKKKLEIQLHKAQKVEAIGTLAGGIAHDFNNLLMGIQGNTSLMQYRIDSSHPNYEAIKNIEHLVKSGAKLTAQLLGYARQGKYKVKPFSLNQVVKETGETFGRARKDITIHRDLSENLFAIAADQGQMEQVLLNLFVNAADSMPLGGDLTLKTMNATHKDINGRFYKPKPGNYVHLTVTDTGTGMDKKTQKRIFDPFFTTKQMGRGTGLGLASVYGIVKGHGGYIDVESQKGHGTTFNIFLPASSRKIYKSIEPSSQPVNGTGTILLVDDEEMVLGVGVKVLENLGYKVLEAKGGREAVEVYNENKDEVDMVILDMIMPEMGGGEVYDRIKEINSNVKVLLSSGYSIDGQANDILRRGCNAFIQKPFTVKELSGRISEILA